MEHLTPARVSTDETSSTPMNNGGTRRVSSSDGPGQPVRRGFHTINVSDPADLQDDDLVRIGGVEMSVRFARNEGVLGDLYHGYKSPAELDPGLSAHATAKGAQETDAEVKSNTGNAEFDTLVDSLNAGVESGALEYFEAQAYETAVGEIALSGLSLDHAMEAFEAVGSGRLNVDDIPEDTRSMLARTEDAVTAAAEKAAISELGDEAFGWLNTHAAYNPQIAAHISRYAADRAMGRHDEVTWAEVYEDIAQHFR